MLHTMSEVNRILLYMIILVCIFIVGINNDLADKEYSRTQNNNGTYSILCLLCTTIL